LCKHDTAMIAAFSDIALPSAYGVGLTQPTSES
jgi:hypothetical protein